MFCEPHPELKNFFHYPTIQMYIHQAGLSPHPFVEILRGDIHYLFGLTKTRRYDFLRTGSRGGGDVVIILITLYISKMGWGQKKK